mgnify:CR=1 FL=1
MNAASSIQMEDDDEDERFIVMGICDDSQENVCSPDKCCVWSIKWGATYFKCIDFRSEGDNCKGLNHSECGCAPELECNSITGKVREIRAHHFF